MRSLNFNCDKQSLSFIKSDTSFYTDSKNYIKINIHFDDTYDDLQKVIIFNYENDKGEVETKKLIYDDNGVNKLPKELLGLNHFYMSLYTLGKVRITTNEELVEINWSGYSNLYEDTGIQHLKKHPSLEMMYEATYYELNYDFAYDFFDKKKDSADLDYRPAGCSAFYGRQRYPENEYEYMCRNLDWYYSKMCSCIIKTKDTVGVAGALADFTTDFVEANDYSDVYTLLPFYLQDGINNYGLCCSTLVVPYEKDKNELSVPKKEKRNSVCSVMLVRYILDNFTSVEHCFDYLRNHVEVFIPKKLKEMGYSQHWFVVDKDGHYGVIELTFEDKTRITMRQFDCASNFSIQNVVFPDSTGDYIINPIDNDPDVDPVKHNKVSPFANGIERHNIMLECRDLHSLDEAKEGLKKLQCTNMYTIEEPRKVWYSDYCGIHSGRTYTCDELDILDEDKKDGLFSLYLSGRSLYSLRSREPTSASFGSWNTNHSVIYDLVNDKMYLTSQENFDNWVAIDIWGSTEDD